MSTSSQGLIILQLLYFLGLVAVSWMAMYATGQVLRQIQEGNMPRATVVTVAEHFDLETVEGGWVTLRRLSYGEKLRKDSDAMRMRFDSKTVDGKEPEFGAEVAIVNEAVTLREIQLCVVDHNLDDGGEEGVREPRKLNLKNVEDIRTLDPRVGSEISDLIDSMNDFERKATTTKVDALGK